MMEGMSDLDDPPTEAQQTIGPIASFVCPQCGNDGQGEDRILFLEEITCHRVVRGVKGGELVIESHYESGDDTGKDHRFECHGCWHQWACPDELMGLIDWWLP